MGCFIVPATEAIVTTIAEKAVKSQEEKKEMSNEVGKISLSKKLGWLNKMLWGGSGLLAFEHIWHGEVSPFFPFLTAMNNINDAQAMLHEMSTVGVSMAVAVTAVWGVMCVVISHILKKEDKVVETVSEKE